MEQLLAQLSVCVDQAPVAMASKKGRVEAHRGEPPAQISAKAPRVQLQPEVPHKLTGRVEAHRDGFRAHMQIRFEGKNRNFRGPSQALRKNAEEDLEYLREARLQRFENKEALVEALDSVSERLSKKKAAEGEHLMQNEVPHKLTGQVEAHRDAFRAHMQVRFEGKNRHFYGPSQALRKNAEEDLEYLREVRLQRFESKEALVEALDSVSERLSKKKAAEKTMEDFENDAEVQELMKLAFETLNLSTVEELLKRGIPIDQRFKEVTWIMGVRNVTYGRNLLMQAAREGNDAVARRLLENHANVEACTADGCTALHDACTKGHIEVAKVLLKCGADPSAETKGGFTPLDSAITWAPNDKVDEMRMLLLECGLKETPARRENWVCRKRSDHSDVDYLDRFRCSSQPAPMPPV